MNLRWRLTAKGNWIASFCGRRATVYLDKRGRWRVVISKILPPDEPPDATPEFFRHTWVEADDAKDWAREALMLRGSGQEGDDPAGPQMSPPPQSAYRPWKAGVRRAAGEPLPEWARVLGVALPLNVAAVRKAYLALAKQHHPDRGGTAAGMAEINQAWEQAQSYFGCRGGIA